MTRLLPFTTNEFPPVRPGHPGVDGARIPAYTNVWNVTREEPDGSHTPLGRWHDAVEIVERDGRALLRRIQRSEPSDGRVQSCLDEVDQATLLPLRTSHKVFGWPELDVTYDGRKVRGIAPVPPAGGPKDAPLPVRIELDLPEPIFDWHLWGVLVASLPLAAGYAARFVGVCFTCADTSIVREVRLQVVSEESVAVGAAGPVPCWVVRLDDDEHWTLWISKTRRPHPVVQLRIESPAGAVRWFRP